MDRRTFLKTTSVAAIPGALAARPAEAKSSLPAPAISSGLKELRFAARWGVEVPVFGSAAQRLAERLERALDGSYRIAVLEPFDDCAWETWGDEADFAYDLAEACIEYEPGFAYFAGLPAPLSLSSWQFQSWLMAGGGQLLWDDLGERIGQKPLLAGHTGTAAGLWTNRPLEGLASLAAASVATGPIGARIARSLGARVIRHDVPALRTSLEAREMVALEWGCPLAAVALGLPHAASHYYPAGLHRGGSALVLSVRSNVWHGLAASDRAIMEAIAAQEFATFSGEQLGHEALVRETIKTIPGLTVADLPAEITIARDKAAGDLLAELEAAPETARIRDSYMAFHALVTGNGSVQRAAAPLS